MGTITINTNTFGLKLFKNNKHFKILFFIVTISILANCNNTIATKEAEKLEYKGTEKSRLALDEKFLKNHSVDAETEIVIALHNLNLKTVWNLRI